MKTNNEKSIFIIYRSILLIVCICIITFINSCQKEESEPPNQFPTCKIISPNNNDAIPFGSQFTISISAADKDGSIKSVSLLINNVEIKKFSSSPYTLTIDTKNYAPGNYTIKAIAMDDKNDVANSEIKISIEALLPEIQTKSISEVNYEKMSVDIICSIISDGGDPINTTGICWSESSNPSIADNTLNSETKTGDFSLNLSNLEYGKTYYIRAYAKNGKGVGYGQELSFNIPAIKPKIETINATNILDRSAESGGIITSDGGAQIIEKGVVWNTSSKPTLKNYKTQDGNGTNEYASLMENLIPNTTYFTRAYATNDAGTSYGNEIEFKTKIGTPILSEVNIKDIAVTSSTMESSVLDNGGSEIVEKGFVWSETQNPSVNNNKKLANTGSNQFNVNIVELKPSTKYYVRAFAKNSKGIGYGDETNFNTLSIPETWLYYDDGSDEGNVNSIDVGDQFTVQFKNPSSFQVTNLNQVKVYFHSLTEANATFDIKLYTSYTVSDGVKYPTGSAQILKANLKTSGGEKIKYYDVNAIINSTYFFVVIENKSTKKIAIQLDVQDTGQKKGTSLLYGAFNDINLYFFDDNIMLRAHVSEGIYDNQNNGRISSNEIVMEPNKSSKSLGLDLNSKSRNRIDIGQFEHLRK